ncbi:NAD(P)/FAD-dependent oxidoreductase [Muriicola sp. Z0-33]|uniref:NAD(P)/FAD-dependent oxidoreductase n=1 Tax=Muriicola sp. Z0-33 TaxID=2816957 RepID=UPI0022384DEC|nr:FAD-dependent oxidoreductase [Muriicola sp. Z0-33]MCW5518021.1 FAD-binding oxidoreductase [Muriicola sp. Z0-33]
MLDYLIVGLGLAGVALSETLEKHGRSFRVVSDTSQTSSIVAAGLYNPVILKRFTLAWKADKQLPLVQPFYAALEKKLGVTLDHKLPVLRRFASIEEQNNWFQAADTPALQPFLSNEIKENHNPGLEAPFGFGQVLGTGRVATKELIENYTDYLNKSGKLEQGTFLHSALKIESNFVSYNAIKAKRIVFAEGFGLHQNPFFNYLPLTGTKGELIKIKAPKLKADMIVKSGVFIVPLGDDYYRVGATYKWKDKTNIPTPEARSELIEKLKAFVKVDFNVEEHLAGIRPTVTDRRPLVGQHPQHKNMYVLNGMGSRGVMIAPYVAEQLFNLIEYDKPLQPEMDIARFYKKYDNR